MSVIDSIGRLELSINLIVQAGERDLVVLPAGFSLTEAHFARAADDLVVTFPDTSRVVVRNYFAYPDPPSFRASEAVTNSDASPADATDFSLAPSQAITPEEVAAILREYKASLRKDDNRRPPAKRPRRTRKTARL